MIPSCAEDSSIAWLSAALEPALTDIAARITKVRATPHGTPGQTADTVSIVVSYDKDHPAPPTKIFAKITASHADTLALAESMDLYRREVSFYRNVKDVDLPVPACCYADFDPDPYQCVLLLAYGIRWQNVFIDQMVDASSDFGAPAFLRSL